MRYKITYKGQGFSNNDFYSAAHWYKRKQLKDKYSKIFNELIENSELDTLDCYKIGVKYNSNHDPSNIVGMLKVFEDVLTGGYNRKTQKYSFKVIIKDDSKKYCKGVFIEPDLELDHNTFEFIVDEYI